MTGATLFAGLLAGNSSTSTLVTLGNGSYLLAVRACSGGITDTACGAFATRAFSVSLTLPLAAPMMTAPSQGVVLTSSTQSFSWTGIAKADPSLPLSYEVQLTDVTAGKTELQIMVPEPNHSTIYSLHSSTEYSLKVRGCQAACGPWSTPVTFSVTLGPVPTEAPVISGTVVNGRASPTVSTVKTDAPLIINADTILTLSVTF